MMKTIFYVLALIVLTAKVNAQTPVRGKVTDLQSKPIAGVTVHLLNTGITTLTNEAGNFSINNIAEGNYTIELTAVGYAALAKVIDVTKNETTTFDFQLQNVLIQLEAVTVTAEKREELLQHIPLSVTAIGSRQAEAMRLWNSKELTAIVPNLYCGNSGDGRNVTSIRGITTTSYDPAVATYIDGVNQFSLDTYIPQLMDIERIEILRGPQGTLYGRNAMGGVINIITKQPSNKSTGFIEATVGNYNLQRYNAGIRLPIIKDKLFFGAAGVFSKRNGYYNNDFNNSSFDKQQEFSSNFYLKYLPAAKWSITINVKQQDNRNDGAFPMVNGVEDALNDPYKVNQNATATMKDKTFNSSLLVNHSGSKINFTSLLAWQTNHRYYDAPLDGDFSPLDAVTVINDYGNKWNKVKVLTHEFRFNSTANKKLNWTAGTYFFHQYNPNKQATHFGKDAGLLGVPDTDFSTINTTEAKNTGIALYGQLNYALTKKLSLTAGLRYDYENKKSNVKGEYQKDGTDAFVITPDTAASVHYSAVSPKLGLQYQASAASSLFANYSRGFRTGGLTQLSSDPSQPPLYPYQPEYSNNIEAGIKNNLFNNRLAINITLFISHINNAQVPTLVLPDAITVTKNTGELSSKGAELELLYKPAKGLQIEYNAGYTDASFRSLKVSGNGQEVNLDGKKQIFTPNVTSMLAVQYSYVINSNKQIKLVARGEWFYLGKQYFDLANTIQQTGYQLANCRAGVSSKHLDVFFWARNIFNKKYIEYAYDFGAVHLGNPGTFGVSVRTQF